MRTIGIDLGTTNSVISYWDVNEPKILINHRGNRIIPSIVSFKKDGSALVGDIARNYMLLSPELTIKESKRNMGEEVVYSSPLKKLKAEDIATYILKNLKLEAENFLKEEVSEAVVTVPAYFTEEQRKATKRAIIEAGLIPKRILNEPTAAALAYATEAHLDGNILVYDLGGGTFDVTILSKEEDDYKVLSSKGNNTLGGMDFNNLVFQEIERDLLVKEGIKKIDPRLAFQLEELIEKAKIELSTEEETPITLTLGLGTKSVHEWTYTLTRTSFNAMIKPLVDSTIDLVQNALSEALLLARDIHTVILSGGSTRVHLVQNELKRILPVDFKSSINPDEVVALGAGVVVGLLTSDLGKKISFQDIVPTPLGLEIQEGQFFPLIHANTATPCRIEHLFEPISLEQKRMVIHILQGENPKASENLSLGCFIIDALGEVKEEPNQEASLPLVNVIFEIDEDGLLSVSAINQKTGEEKSMVIFSKNEIDNQSLLKETKDEIESLWLSLKNKSFLSEQEKELIGEVRMHLDSSNIRLLKRLHSVLQYYLYKS